MKSFRRIAVLWWRNERGQDVAEYCLITALIALVALGIFWHVSGGLQGTWSSMNTSLAAGNNTTAASPSSTGLAGN
jgi:Flp pilus assembly pilin Flp